MEFRVLGAFEISTSGRDVTPTAPKTRQTAALLLLRRNAVVHKEELIDELWDDDPPRSATTTLQTYIHKLRRIFEMHGRDLLETRPNGYRLCLPESAVDLDVFEAAVRAAQTSQSSGRVVDATDRLRAGLAAWRGPAIGGVTKGRLLTAYAQGLEESRIRAQELSIELNMVLGRHSELIGDLRSLTTMHPFHESFHASLMTALRRAGRRAEALLVFRSLRARMCTELGLEPGELLQHVHREVLMSEPDGDPRRPTVGARC